MLDKIDINKLTLDELNEGIKKLAPKINRELKSLAMTQGKYKGTPIQELELGYVQDIANEAIAGVKMVSIKTDLYSGSNAVRIPSFSSARASTINEGRSRLAALIKIDKSSASPSKLSKVDSKRKKSFSDMLGKDLTQREYEMLTDALSKSKEVVGGSQRIITAFELYSNAVNSDYSKSKKINLSKLIEIEMNSADPVGAEATDYLMGLGFEESEIWED